MSSASKVSWKRCSEALGPYLLRMGRAISALSTLGRAAPDGASEAVTRKAKMIEVYAEFGELDRPKAVRYLRDKFMALSVDEAMEPQEKEGTIIALGGKPSKSDLKVFSTPSAESKGSGPDAHGPSGRGVMITMKSAEGGLGQAAGSPARSDAGSESRLRAKLAAAEMELEALRQVRLTPRSEARRASPPRLKSRLES